MPIDFLNSKHSDELPNFLTVIVSLITTMDIKVTLRPSTRAYVMRIARLGKIAWYCYSVIAEGRE